MRAVAFVKAAAVAAAAAAPSTWTSTNARDTHIVGSSMRSVDFDGSGRARVSWMVEGDARDGAANVLCDRNGLLSCN